MFRKDNFIVGVLLGSLLPGLAWVYEKTMVHNLVLSHSNKIIYLFAIALNLIMVRMAFKKDFEKAGRGMMLTTFLALIAMFYFKLKQ